MDSIIGLVIDVKQFIKNEKTAVNVEIDNKMREVFKLDKDRIYSIPDFQREIRWNKENVMELINDINNVTRFLGNIIISNKPNTNVYDIIDGQQRTTIIMMLMKFIEIKHKGKLNPIEPCKLLNQSL